MAMATILFTSALAIIAGGACFAIGYALGFARYDDAKREADQLRRMAIAWRQTARQTSKALEAESAKLGRMASALRAAQEREADYANTITTLRAAIFQTERALFAAQNPKAPKGRKAKAKASN